MTWIKVCGTTNLDDARAAADAGADALGFVLAPSPRRIDAERAGEIVAGLPRRVEKVGVFVNETAERIREIVERAGLNAVQLHGDETPEFAAGLFRGPGKVTRAQVRIFKALAVAPGIETELRRFIMSHAVDGILLDSADHNKGLRGGTGRSFDWDRVEDFLPGVAAHMRIVLAGGLGPENVGAAIRKLCPWGVDVCTGVEREPGKKDPEKLLRFISAVRGVACPRTAETGS